MKVGYTISLTARLIGMQVDNHRELRVLASCRGGREEESLAHLMLTGHSIRGEWFRRDEFVDAYIQHVSTCGSVYGWEQGERALASLANRHSTEVAA